MEIRKTAGLKPRLSLYDFLIFIVIGMAAWFYFVTQPQITEHNGLGSDGRDYFKMYQYFKGLEVGPEMRYPFCKRPGTPYLASLLPFNPVTSFLVINLIAGAIATIVVFYTLKNIARNDVAWAVTIPLIFYQFSPVRFPYFYPYIIDPPVMMFYASAVYFISKERFWLAIFALVFSCSFKEQGVYLALIIGPILLFRKECSWQTCFAMITVAALGGLINWSVAFPSLREGSQLATVLDFIYRRFSQGGAGLISALNGIALTLAPFLIIYGLNKPHFSIKTLKTGELVSLVWLCLSLVMSILGGADTNRIFFVTYPLIVIFLAKLISNQSSLRIAYFSFFGLIANDFIGRIWENPRLNLVPVICEKAFNTSMPLPASSFLFYALVLVMWFILTKIIKNYKRFIL